MLSSSEFSCSLKELFGVEKTRTAEALDQLNVA